MDTTSKGSHWPERSEEGEGSLVYPRFLFQLKSKRSLWSTNCRLPTRLGGGGTFYPTSHVADTLKTIDARGDRKSAHIFQHLQVASCAHQRASCSVRVPESVCTYTLDVTLRTISAFFAITFSVRGRPQGAPGWMTSYCSP